jgi:polyamine oxidase
MLVFAAILGCSLALESCSLDLDGRAENVEVLVLGAGISGVAAARTMEVNGVSDFLVLEAGNRIGGRIREYDDTTIEVGANWIHGLDPDDPKHHPIWREWTACDPSGPSGSLTPDYTDVYDADGNEIDLDVYKAREGEFFEAYDAAAELDATIDTSLRQGLTTEGWVPSGSLDNFIDWTHVDGCTAIEPENISLVIHSGQNVYTAFTEKDEEAEDYLIVDKDGFSFVVRCMARKFADDRVKLESTVTKISVADDCVCAVVEDSDMYCGDYGIVTFSAGVLQAAIRGDQDSVVEFDPPLPEWKQDAINKITPVYYGKVFLVFPETFWNETDEDQQVLGYVSDERGYFGFILLDKNRPNTVTVDITGDLALRVARQSEEETVNEVLAVLRKIFSDATVPEPDTAIISSWPIDPLFRQAWAEYGPGVPENIFDELLKPVNDRLYFAGDALNRTNYGYTQGAYGTGVYAAEQVSMMMSTDSGNMSQAAVGSIFLAVAVTLLSKYVL